jgi:HEPN domain-containing protein
MLKAFLAFRGVDYPKTHNLRVLVELLSAEGLQLLEKLAEIDRLTQFGTTFRYDSLSFADGKDRVIWLGWIRDLRVFVEPLIRE